MVRVSRELELYSNRLKGVARNATWRRRDCRVIRRRNLWIITIPASAMIRDSNSRFQLKRGREESKVKTSSSWIIVEIKNFQFVFVSSHNHIRYIVSRVSLLSLYTSLQLEYRRGEGGIRNDCRNEQTRGFQRCV